MSLELPIFEFLVECHNLGSDVKDQTQFLTCPADSHLVEFDRRHADAYGDGLAGFAAGSYAFIQGEVVAYHGDVLEGFGAVAYEGGSFDGAGDLAVFDEVGLGGGEDELAVGDVDLSSTEVDGVEAALDGLDDVLGQVVTVEHVGVGHARHGDVVVALAAAGAGVGGSHEAGGEFVGEVALEDAVFDEDGLLGGVALVIDVDGAAAVGHAAVVDYGDLAGGDLLTDEAGEGGCLLAVEVGFEAMADGFVQEDAGPSGAEDYFHLTGGSGYCSQLEDGGAGGLAGKVLGGFIALEEVHGDTAASAGGASGGAACAVVARGVFGDDEDVEAGERLGVGGEGPVGAGDENAAELVGEAGTDLGDAGVVGAGGDVGALDEGEFLGDLGVGGGSGDGVERLGLGVTEALDELLGGAGGDESSGAGGLEESVGGEVVGVGVARALAGEDTDAATEGDALGGGLDERLVDAERGGGDGLEVEVGVIAPGGESFGEAALDEAFGDAEFRGEVVLVVGGGDSHLHLMIGGGCGCGNG